MRAPSRQPLHMVSAWAARQRVVLAQEAVDEKANEIVAIPLLLERLQLTGALVTIDACDPIAHLSEDERDQIGVLRAAGRSMGAIARALGRAKATISRELQRNALPLGGYSPLHAAGAYQLRRRREAILEREAALRLFVGDRLAEGWTPEQISGWLKSGNEPRLRAIGCETIYGFIYRTAQKAAALWRYLTRRHKRRRPRRARASRDAIKDRASIHDRPKTIEGRGEAGHWEGDLIICKRTRPVLVLHERKSRRPCENSP